MFLPIDSTILNSASGAPMHPQYIRVGLLHFSEHCTELVQDAVVILGELFRDVCLIYIDPI